VSSQGFSNGLYGAWHHWAGVIGMIILGAWGIGRLREMDTAYTLPELLGRAYGTPSRAIVAVVICIAWLGIIAAQFVAAGSLVAFLGSTAGWWDSGQRGTALFIALIGVITGLYTLLGGQRAVLRTDLVQGLLIVLAVVAIAAVAKGAMGDGGLSLSNDQRNIFFSETNRPASWLLLLLTVGVPFMIGPDIYSRIFCCKDKRSSQAAVLVAALALIPIAFLITYSGAAVSVLYGEELSSGRNALPFIASELLHPVLFGAFMAALLATVMSSADTCLMTFGTLFSRDVALSGKSEEDDRRSLMLAKGAIAVGTVIAILMAIALPDIIGLMIKSYSIYSPAVLAPFLVMMIWPGRVFHPEAGIVAIGSSALLAILSIVCESTALQLAAFATPFIVLGGSAALMKKLEPPSP